ncbi:CPBP family intramembrane metalloprotease [Chlorobaculum thiosulfatiphilum]|uniref:CPBP family intramembrane metalloprotease n=1 Tax=Chlorobaculum thiosulfatiphilum TaxID=115852 RepID=A0A5C4S6U7_CHLTI|nr:CPBP family glutamic-type intramembrane protease [Chlorobaculum thiosulfatiphilum]TNJ38868.1 CPBP family intramembrane metalloprotease [Chlorobaculum thiosulfatiphilum]
MIPTHRLLVPYAAPYFAYVLIATVAERFVPMEVNYLLRIVIVSATLLWARQWFFSFRGPKSPVVSTLVGILAGVAGLILWIALLTPFVSIGDGKSWSQSAFILRLLAAGFLVPVFEEVLMRGFIFRLALQWDEARKSKATDALSIAMDRRSVNDVQPGAWSWAAIIVSTLVFTLGHTTPEWPASIAYGLLMAGLYILRRDLLSCIVAHGVTNIALAIYVYQTGKWYLW